MSKILFSLSLIAAAVAAPATASAAATCYDFSAAGFCDAMQFDAKKKASWHNYDCAGSSGKQTTANLKKGKTTCDGTMGCNPAAAYGWDSLNWKFNKANSTGTLTGSYAGSDYVLQQDMPVSIYAGACAVQATKGGKSVLAQ